MHTADQLDQNQQTPDAQPPKKSRVHSSFLTLGLLGMSKGLPPNGQKELVSNAAFRIAELEMEKSSCVVLTPNAITMLDHVLGIYDPADANCQHYPDGDAPSTEAVEELRILLKTAKSIRVIPDGEAYDAAQEEAASERQAAEDALDLDIGAGEEAGLGSMKGIPALLGLDRIALPAPDAGPGQEQMDNLHNLLDRILSNAQPGSITVISL